MVATATTTETITTTCSFVRGLLYFYNLHNHKVFEITPTLYQGFSDSAIYCFLKYLILAYPSEPLYLILANPFVIS